MQRSLARQLIALLPVLAAALAVALAGDHGAAAAFPTDVAGGQRQVDQRRAVLHAFGLMLQSARVHGDGAIRFRKPMRGLFDRLRRNARHLARGPGIESRYGGLDRLESAGVLFDEGVVLQVVAQHHVQHSAQQHQIGAGAQRQEQIRVARDGRHPRIGDDQLAAVVPAPPDVVGGDRRAFADVRANNEQHLRLWDFAPGNRTAIDIECQLVGDTGGNHAEPAVVIDVSGSQRHARKFTHQVGLLGRERRAAVNRDRVLAVTFLDFPKTPRGESHRVFPTGLHEAARPCAAADRADDPDDSIANSA